MFANSSFHTASPTAPLRSAYVEGEETVPLQRWKTKPDGFLQLTSLAVTVFWPATVPETGLGSERARTWLSFCPDIWTSSSYTESRTWARWQPQGDRLELPWPGKLLTLKADPEKTLGPLFLASYNPCFFPHKPTAFPLPQLFIQRPCSVCTSCAVIRIPCVSVVFGLLWEYSLFRSWNHTWTFVGKQVCVLRWLNGSRGIKKGFLAPTLWLFLISELIFPSYPPSLADFLFSPLPLFQHTPGFQVILTRLIC